MAFRKRFVGELGDLFVHILMMARSMGLLKLGTVSLTVVAPQNLIGPRNPGISAHCRLPSAT